MPKISDRMRLNWLEEHWNDICPHGKYDWIEHLTSSIHPHLRSAISKAMRIDKKRSHGT